MSAGKRGVFGRFMFIWSIVFIFLLALSVFITAALIIKSVERDQQGLLQNLNVMQDQIRDQRYHFLFQHVQQKYNLSQDSNIQSLYFPVEKDVFYDEGIIQIIEFVLTDCNPVSFLCTKVPRNHDTPFHQQFPLERVRLLFVTKDAAGSDVAIIIQELPDQVIFSIPYPSSIPQYLPVWQGLQADLDTLHLEILSRQIAIVDDPFEKLKSYLFGSHFDQIANEVLFQKKIDFRFAKINNAIVASEEEMEYFPASPDNRIVNYKKLVQEYRESIWRALENSIDQLQEPLNHDYEIPLTAKSFNTIFFLLPEGRKYEHLERELAKLREENLHNVASSRIYDYEYSKEPELSQLLRAKIAAAEMANLFITACQNYRNQDNEFCTRTILACESSKDTGDCIIDFIEAVNSPHLCSEFILQNRERCYLRFPSKNRGESYG